MPGRARSGCAPTSRRADGDPNHDGATEWPEVGDGAFLDFGNAGARVVEDDPWTDRLDVLELAAE